ncbi:hypothetical protein HPR92_06155 [Pseudomonas aeruginosa]|uniref:hypothetical protein n=1 Tax=Pseudomonas aeruginosa TaxID=287 RepID=UPI0015C54F58|nr:hypothetical protein [Pseudomonas aeruginosa]NPW45281.1 hypothetical protein [Pseudomonas aeruginosa]
MTESKICTCPSGDGSLRWPCPKHPAVEQAVGDERAAFELFVRKHCGMPEHIAVNWDAKFTNDAWEGWQARAALAQPSPAQAEQHWQKLEKPAQVGAIRFRAGLSSRLVVEAAQRLYEFESTPEKEAERIERLQAFREQCFEPLGAEFSKVLSENLVELSSDAKPEQADEKPGDSILCYGCFAKGVGPDHFDEAGKCLAAQAEAERPEGPTEDELEAAGLGYPLHKEEAVKLWYSGFRSEVITVLEAWEAIGHDIGMNPDKGELLDSLRYMLEKCEAHDAALAEVAGLRSLLNSLLCYVERDIDRMRSDRDKSDNKEIYDRSISLAMERLKAAQNAVFTTEPGCDTAVELAAQTTQAQHSVPGKYDDVLLPFLKSMEHELHANAGKGDRPGWLQMDRRTALLEIYYHLAKLQKATKDNDAAGIVEYAADVANMSMMLVDVCGLLAAAPGKEGV